MIEDVALKLLNRVDVVIYENKRYFVNISQDEELKKVSIASYDDNQVVTKLENTGECAFNCDSLEETDNTFKDWSYRDSENFVIGNVKQRKEIEND